MNSYNREQFEALAAVRQQLAALSAEGVVQLKKEIYPYLLFRKDVDEYLKRYFSVVCSRQCYRNARSACCSREGIITFFADVVVNALVSGDTRLEELRKTLQEDRGGLKCVYLGPKGCRWRVRPIVCAMFLCDAAQEQVFASHPEAAGAWHELEGRRKSFTWPDRPVLFDRLEAFFLARGLSSPLMYLHNSPGMVMLKGKWREHP